MISFREPPDGPCGDDRDPVARLWLEVAGRLPPQEFETWFRDTPCQFRPPDMFVITARNRFQASWIRTKYREALLEAAEDVLGGPSRLEVEEPHDASRAGDTLSSAADGSEGSGSASGASTERPGDPAETAGSTADPSSPGNAGTPIRGTRRGRRKPSGSGDPDSGRSAKRRPPASARELTFEDFVTGPGNRVAHAAALTVAEQPGGPYNPLWIHGPSATGKSHLLQAIARHLEAGRDHTVLFLTAESFANRYAQATRRGDVDEFRRQCVSADALLIDDLHFLGSKSRTQEEFLLIVRRRIDDGRQVVLSSHAAPDDLGGWSQRLTSRVRGGLLVTLDPPEADTRLRLLLRKALTRGHELPADAAQCLVDGVEGGLRELEGALTHLIGLARLERLPLAVDLARRVVEELRREQHERTGAIGVEEILDAISRYFGVRSRDLLSNTKVRAIAYARQVGMYLARELTPLSLEQIGLRFGGRDHTTVRYAQERIRRDLARRPQVKTDVRSLRARLTRDRPG